MRIRRQLIAAGPRPTIEAPRRQTCGPLALGTGTITLANGDTIDLTGGTFRPSCTNIAVIANGPDLGGTGISVDDMAGNQLVDFPDLAEPFYASTFPQCYALAATTVIAWMLVIMLIITPRSFLDGGVVVLGRRNGFTRHRSGTTIGDRPTLQKVAASFVAISLTIATVETFRVAEDQYNWNTPDADAIQAEVLDGTLLKVIRIISDFFLWSAQTQTLLRLFPRHREKVVLKWVAASLIVLDIIFEGLNSFLPSPSGPTGPTRPRAFTEPVPAISYVFQLLLGVLYAALVIVYSISKRRYAFYHTRMRNIGVVALISIISLIVPILFFILDVSRPALASWGDYVRWVGAAAASVVVWEWVERIEALEREEKKDAVLGREIFDGDEGYDNSPSEFSGWIRRRKGKGDGGGLDDDPETPDYKDGYMGPTLESGNDGLAGKPEGDARDGAERSHSRPLWPGVTRLAGRRGARGNNGRQPGRPGEKTQKQRSTARAARPRRDTSEQDRHNVA